MDALNDVEEEDLEPIPGCPDRALGAYVVLRVNPHSYATMPKIQHAIVRHKWNHGLHTVVEEFRRNPELRALATDPITGVVHTISQSGVITACIWFVRGIPWTPGRRGGRCAMVNQDQIVELRDYLREHGSMPREDLAAWLLGRRRERFTRQLHAVLTVLAGGKAAAKEFAMMDQEDQRCRSWANKWLAMQSLHLKRAQKLEAARWHAATRGTIRRWFAEMDALFRAVRAEMVYNFDELMVASSRAGKAVVTGDEQLFSPQGRKTPHVTLGACFNCRGDSPPPLLVMAGPQCALEELASLHGRSLWLCVNHSGWVDRIIFRQWCQWFAAWVVQMRAQWGLGPEEEAILVLDNAPTRGDLTALEFLAANRIHVVTLPPHLTHIMQPVDVCWARAFKTAYGHWLRRYLKEGGLERAYAQLPPAASRGRRTAARDSRVCVAFAAADAAKAATSTFNASHAFAAAGLIPFNAEKPLASQYVRNCDADVERQEEAKTPLRIHTGSRVLTSPEFLERLAAFVAGQQRQTAALDDAAMVTAEHEPEPQPLAPGEDLEVDLLAPVAKAFEKLTAVTERIDPTAPGLADDDS